MEDDQVERNESGVEDPGIDSEGEDPIERNEYEVAVVVAGFNEDAIIRHDVYWQSDDESDGDSDATKERNRKYTPRCDGILFKGQKFLNRIAFKEAVLHYAMKNNRNIRQRRYDTKKMSFICLGKMKNGIACRWRVYGSVRKGSGKWQIRLLSDNHSCEKSGQCKLLKVSAIARLYVDKIRDDPEHWKPIEIEESIFEKWGISVSRNQVQSARLKALKWIEADYDDQFRRLRDYGNELLLSNPGSSVEVQSCKNPKGEEVFERFYVCFDGLRKSWKGYCRPLLGVDGTFLKGKVKGQLLVALGRDGDNRIYLIAWGVVGVENAENWTWFVKKIQEDLELGDGTSYVIVSDRQKGLIKAVSSELPGVEHRHCVRHIYTNLKSKFGKMDPMKKFIWDLAWSYNATEFAERLQDLKNFDDDVYEWVMKSEPKSWCRAFYKIGPHCEDVENNSTESFNSTIVKARGKPFVPMLEAIRTLAMTRIAKRNKVAEKHDGILTPYASELVELEEDLAKACKVKTSTHGMWQATISGCCHRVNLDLKTCTCRKWQIRGIPCEHAYGVILHNKLYVEEYVSCWFHTEVWRKTYEHGITPPRGSRFWPRGNHPPIIYPTYTEKKSKKEERKKGKNESPKKKKEKGEKRAITCGHCGVKGHNARFHKLEKNGGKGVEKGKKTDKKGKRVSEKGKAPEKKGKGVTSSQNQSKRPVKQANGSRKKQKLNEAQSTQSSQSTLQHPE